MQLQVGELDEDEVITIEVIFLLTCSHPVFAALPTIDRGAWIPPPAQCSKLQSLPTAPGHRHTLGGHQTVSFKQTHRSVNSWLLFFWSLMLMDYNVNTNVTLILIFFFLSLSHAITHNSLTFTDNCCL